MPHAPKKKYVLSFRKKTTTLVAVASFLFAVLFAVPVQAGKASLADIVVTNTWDHLLVYFTVTNCFNDEMKKAIENGIPTTFTFFIRLYRVKRFWWDENIADLKVSHEIRYDNLKKVYTVKLSEKEGEVIRIKDFEKARRIMSEIAAFKVTELQNLTKGGRYQVRMMAELDTITLPFNLHYVFFFLSLWDFETDWYTVDFRY